MSFLQDIKTAVKLTAEVSRARKEGKQAKVRAEYAVPFVNFGYWTSTPEACLFCGPERIPIRDFFETLPEDMQHDLTFAPKDGEFPARCRFWKEHLRGVLPPKQYHAAMLILIGWGKRCAYARLDNNQRFNDLLNNCQNPRAVYTTLSALAPVIREAGENAAV